MASHLNHEWAQKFDFLLSRQSSDDLDHALLGHASTFLHQQLTTRFEASEWPLQPLRDFLDYVIGKAPDSKAALIPTTPLLNTTDSDIELSPRSARVKDHLKDLSQLPIWEELLTAYEAAYGLAQKGFLHMDFINAFANRILEHRGRLSILQGLESVQAASFAPAIKEAFQILQQTNKATWNSSEKLSYVLELIASLNTPETQDPQVVGTISHLAGQLGRQYRGDAPYRFYNFALQLNRSFDRLGPNDPKPYFRGTPIVQSSGTGKTRMVLELRHFAPLLYVCFRKTSNNANAGYPLADRGVRGYFVKANTSHPHLCDLQIACFLCAWFEILAATLQQNSNSKKVIPVHQILFDLNKLDDGHVRNMMRDTFFEDVSKRASALLATASEEQKRSGHEKIFKHFLRSSVIALSTVLHDVIDHFAPLLSDERPPIFVAVDECVEINVSEFPPGNTQLNSLRRAWNYIGQLQDARLISPFWLVLLSTSSSAAHLVDHHSSESSVRRRNAAYLPTFVGVGFDALTSEQHNVTSAAGATTYDQIVKYGRPLWSSLERSEFWSTAILKLQGAETFTEDNANQCFSVLASRLALRLVPIHRGGSSMFGELKTFTDNMVDRHMRILTHVNANAALRVESPSEPVLAIAASLIMLSTNQEANVLARWQQAVNKYGSILEWFKMRCLSKSAIGLFKGTQGELGVRLALTIAWDAVKYKEMAASPPPNLEKHAEMLSAPVLLDNIIANLANLDEQHSSLIQERIQSVCASVSAKYRSQEAEAGAQDKAGNVQAWTNFTHFDILPEPITTISPEYLWYCWKRGVALQMAHTQDGIDGIIPVFIGDLAKPFASMDGSTAHSSERYAARHMTYVAWEAKNRKIPQNSLGTKPQPRTGDGNVNKPSRAKRDRTSSELNSPKRVQTSHQASEAPSQDVMHLGPEQVSLSNSKAKLSIAKLAGVEILPAFECDEAPLTPRALLTVLADLGTTTPFQDTGDQRPRVEIIPGTLCPRLWIRGMDDLRTYPCLDKLKVRAIFKDFLGEYAEQSFDESLNVVQSPLWNDRICPSSRWLEGSPMQSPAETMADTPMDLDR